MGAGEQPMGGSPSCGEFRVTLCHKDLQKNWAWNQGGQATLEHIKRAGTHEDNFGGETHCHMHLESMESLASPPHHGWWVFLVQDAGKLRENTWWKKELLVQSILPPQHTHTSRIRQQVIDNVQTAAADGPFSSFLQNLIIKLPYTHQWKKKKTV